MLLSQSQCSRLEFATIVSNGQANDLNWRDEFNRTKEQIDNTRQQASTTFFHQLTQNSSSILDRIQSQSQRSKRQVSASNLDYLQQADVNCLSATQSAAIFGIRCDNENEVSDGILVIKANEATELTLIGQNLDKNVSVALTSEESSPQSDCTHADRVRSLKFTNISSNVAKILVDVPSLSDKRAYHLCLRDSRGRWFHQGTQTWLKLYVKEDFLPLYMKVVLVGCLLMLSGLFSGLNLGLMALDKNELQVIISCGSDTEKRYARAIEPVRRRGNYLLCSILFSNVLVNSTIAVLLEELTSGIVAVMTSTIFIVMFGEILPQSFCSRHGLAVGAKTVSITYFCMIVTFPLSYPVSSCLDWVLGEEIGHAYDRERLMEFIRVTRDYNNLETDEVNIISGALKLKRIPLSQVMTRIEDVYMLDINSSLDFDTIQSIIERGYSRIPVHEAGNKKNIVALLFAKDLALLDPDDCTPVKTLISFYNHPIMYLFEDTTLDLALNEFKTGKSHMAIVRRVLDDGDRDPVYEITGVVTLEDVIEEIMQMEINDETDTLSDNRRKRRRKEAQVRRDFSQFTHFGAGETSENVVSPQLCLAAYQYLATTVEPFSSKYISDNILKRLLSQRIYFKLKVEDTSPQERRLYTSGEPTDCFIMILEGRVHVVCGRENLVFEGGPFSFFGQAALLAHSAHPVGSQAQQQQQQLSQQPANFTKTNLLSQYDSPLLIAATEGSPSRKESSSGQPADRRESLLADRKFNGQISASISLRKPELIQQTGEQPEPEMVSPTASLTSTQQKGSIVPVSSNRPIKKSDSRVSISTMDNQKSASGQCFVPDYTVEVVTTSSYLKITRNEYLAALKATLVERGSPSGGTELLEEGDEMSLSSRSSATSAGRSPKTNKQTSSTKPNNFTSTSTSAVANNIELFSKKQREAERQQAQNT